MNRWFLGGQSTTQEFGDVVRGARTRVRPTGRGYGVAVTVVGLAVAGRLSGSLGTVPLVVGLITALLVSLLSVLTLLLITPGRLHVSIRGRPALVAVGQPCRLEVLLADAEQVRMPTVGLDPPDWHWRTTAPRADGGLEPSPTPSPPARLGWRSPGRAGLLRVRSPRAGRTEQGGSFAVPTARRGILEAGPLRVWQHDPLGLVGAVVAITRPVTVVVHPHPAPVPPGLLADSIGPASTVTTFESVLTGAGDWGGDFAELRPYRPGDRLTSVHWQAQARHGTLLVRQFEPEASGLVRVVMDDRTGTHHRHTYEQALSLVLGLVEAANQAGLAVELSTLSGRAATFAPSTQGLAEAMELLATMSPRPASEWDHLDLLISEFGGFTLVTTATGAPRLPDAVAARAHVVTAG